MGLVDFFKDKFGKKACSLCGKECGMMSRTKVKNGDFLCDDCGNKCSKYVRLSEMTLDDIKGHMEYMKRQNRLFEEVYFKEGRKDSYPSTISEEGIEFCDDLGMFRIKYRNNMSRGKMNELFRYDQVASYEEYCDETKPTEPGKEPEFKAAGLKIKLVGTDNSSLDRNNEKGLRTHPYIKREINVCFTKKNVKEAIYAHNAKTHFDNIFGVHDSSSSLFGFGMNKEEKRQLMGAVGMVNAFTTAVKAAKKGEEALSDEDKAKMQENLNAMSDASTGGMAVYTRRADAAEAKIS